MLNPSWCPPDVSPSDHVKSMGYRHAAAYDWQQNYDQQTFFRSLLARPAVIYGGYAGVAIKRHDRLVSFYTLHSDRLISR